MTQHGSFGRRRRAAGIEQDAGQLCVWGWRRADIAAGKRVEERASFRHESGIWKKSMESFVQDESTRVCLYLRLELVFAQSVVQRNERHASSRGAE